MRLNFARSVAVSLALCAMVLRAVLPDGWMPAAGASPFAMCSIDAAQMDGKAPAQTPSRHAPCAFASNAPLAPPAIVAVPAARSEYQRLAFGLAPDANVRAQVHHPNTARAPPRFS